MKELTQKEFASLGGKASLKKHGVEHFIKMGKKSAEANRERLQTMGKLWGAKGRLTKLNKQFKAGTINEIQYIEQKTKLDALIAQLSLK